MLQQLLLIAVLFCALFSRICCCSLAKGVPDAKPSYMHASSPLSAAYSHFEIFATLVTFFGFALVQLLLLFICHVRFVLYAHFIFSKRTNFSCLCYPCISQAHMQHIERARASKSNKSVSMISKVSWREKVNKKDVEIMASGFRTSR